MLHKTGGIALSFIKYKESSIIARIYTEAFGLQSYIVNGVRSKKAKTKIALFQPLTLLDLVVYHNKKRDINRISEIKCNYNFHTIPFQIKKTSIALFLTELLNQLLSEEENEHMYLFLRESIQYFDTMETGYENFHLQLLLGLSKYLGILPPSGLELLKEVGHAKAHDPKFVDIIHGILNKGYEAQIAMNGKTRSQALQAIIDYYRFHYDGIRELKSMNVLKEVLN